MQTAQQIINNVLTSLRRPTITTPPISDPYQLLLLEFFNQTKKEVEDATNWRALDVVTTISIPASTGFGAAGGGYYAAITGSNERSRVRRAPIPGGGMSQAGYAPAITPADRSVALVFDTTAPTTSGYFPLYEIPLDILRFKLNDTNWQTNAQPQFFALAPGNEENGGSGSGVQYLYVYPPVSTARTITVTMVTPQTDFNSNLQDANSVSTVLVPPRPVIAGLRWHAFEERGEELGPSNAFSEEKFRDILDDAVGIENAESGNNLDLYLE